MHTVEKEWGTETWLVNEPEYCAKWLDLKGRKMCSFHYHGTKKETFIVLIGTVKLERLVRTPGGTGWTPMDEVLSPGESRTIYPGILHRFSSHEHARILEVSTHHDDEDVVRLVPSGDYDGI